MKWILWTKKINTTIGLIKNCKLAHSSEGGAKLAINNYVT